LQSPEVALPTPKPKVQLPERSHHWRPSRRQICIWRPRSHPSRTTRNCQSGRALGRTRPPCCVGNGAEITQEVTSNSVKPAPPRLNAFRASPPPRVACPPLLPQDAARQRHCKPAPPSTPSAASRRTPQIQLRDARIRPPEPQIRRLPASSRRICACRSRRPNPPRARVLVRPTPRGLRPPRARMHGALTGRRRRWVWVLS